VAKVVGLLARAPSRDPMDFDAPELHPGPAPKGFFEGTPTALPPRPRDDEATPLLSLLPVEVAFLLEVPIENLDISGLGIVEGLDDVEGRALVVEAPTDCRRFAMG
jgi:hypothetical protein